MTPPPPRAAVSPRRPAPAPAGPRHLEVVRGRPTPGRRPPTLFVAVAVAAMVLALLALVLTNVMLGQAGFRVAELRARVTEKSVDVEQMRLEVERMDAPAWLAQQARRLGMVPGVDVTVIAPSAQHQGTTSNVRGPSPGTGRD